MAISFYGANALTGGATGSLDGIDGTGLLDGDGAVVITGGYFLAYTLDADSAAPEISPTVIKPDDNAGNKRWILCASSSVILENDLFKFLDGSGVYEITFDFTSTTTQNRSLIITTGDASRTIILNGNPTLSDWFDQAVKAASSPTFNNVTLTNGALLPEVSSAPTTAANQIAIYAKDVSAVSELYLRKESSGAEVRITQGDSLMGSLPTGLGPLPWSTNTAPSGWLMCDGAAVSRVTYSDLYAVIGDTFGNGNGSTTFNVPDCRGRFPLGKDNMGGSSANRVTDADADTLGGADGDELKDLSHTHTGPAHTHELPFGTVANGYELWQDESSASGTTVNFTARTTGSASYPSVQSRKRMVSFSSGTGVTGSGCSATQDIMPPFITVNYIIKT